jgi:hypothetical protein
MMPALLIRMSTRPYALVTSRAARFVSSRSARSSEMMSTFAPGESAMIRATAASALLLSRAVTTRWAPCRASSIAVWVPSPPVTPVMTARLPDRSGMSAVLQLMRPRYPARPTSSGGPSAGSAVRRWRRQ